MMPASCPDPARLQELVGGTLAAEDEARLTTHLDSCISCRQKLEALAGEEFRLMGPVAEGSGPSPDAEPALAAVMAQLQKPSGEEWPTLPSLAPPAHPGNLGRLGHYEVLSVVGRGGMGIVLKARDETLDRIVAIKVMAPQLAASAAARQRFLREARAAAAIRDEHVVDIHAVQEHDGLPYMVMEYINGASLQDRLNEKGPVELREILRIGMQAAKGLAAAHAQGLVHRDIKPSNILLENHVERVKISDFGLARAVDDASHTQSGVVAGTPEYMAPEQANGEIVDHRADLFSLGSVLYVMCAGRPPFRAHGALAVLKRVSEDTPRSLRAINPEIPDWLESIVARLHAKSPADRIQTAAEAAELLGRHLALLQQGDCVVHVSPVSAHRARWKHALGILALLLLLGIAVLGVAIPRQNDHQTTDKTRAEDPLAPPSGAPTAKFKKSLIGHGQGVLSVAYSPNGRLLASGDDVGEVRVWTMPEGTPRYVLPARGQKLHALAFSTDSKFLLTAGAISNGDINIWDAETGQSDDALKGHTSGLYQVSFGPDGKTLVSGGWDHTIRVWDFAARGEVHAIPSPDGEWIRSVVVSASGKIAVGGGEQGKVFLLEPDGQLVQTFDTSAGPLCFSPDGRLLAGTTWREGQVTIWDVNSRKEIGSWHAHEGMANGVAFWADGRILATAGGDDLVRLWDIATQSQLAELRHEGHAYYLAFSPDGATLATTAMNDLLVKLWDVSFLRSLKLPDKND